MGTLICCCGGIVSVVEVSSALVEMCLCLWQNVCKLSTDLTRHIYRRPRRHTNTHSSCKANNSFELKQSPLSHCDIINQAGGVPLGPSFGARHILQQSSSCDAAVSLRGPDRQCREDDSPQKRAQEQVETIDGTLGSNYERNPRACSKEPTACLSLSEIQPRPLMRNIFLGGSVTKVAELLMDPWVTSSFISILI